MVVPAYREVAALTRTLESLLALEERPTVVVAVDGAHPATVDVARDAGVEVVLLPVNGGSYAARNAAVAHLECSGLPDLVLFTDAECVVTPGWLREHRLALEHADLSAGAVRFTFRSDRPSPAEWVDAVRHLQQERYVHQDGYGATCNLAVRGSVLARHRFDDSLRTGGDAEFCRRVVRQGGRLVYSPEAEVEHPARDLRALWDKVDRLVGGVPGQAERWRGRPVPRRLPTRAAWRQAVQVGRAGGLGWGLAVTGLDWVIAQRVRRAVLGLEP